MFLGILTGTISLLELVRHRKTELAEGVNDTSEEVSSEVRLLSSIESCEVSDGVGLAAFSADSDANGDLPTTLRKRPEKNPVLGGASRWKDSSLFELLVPCRLFIYYEFEKTNFPINKNSAIYMPADPVLMHDFYDSLTVQREFHNFMGSFLHQKFPRF